MLAGYGAEGRGTLLESAVVDPDPAVRVRAVGALARRGGYTATLRRAALQDPACEVRRRACSLEARSPSGDPEVEVALVACLADDDPLVVVGAASALGESAAAGSVPALSGVARSHRDPRCREAAIAALGAIGDPAGLGAVLHGLDDRPAIRRRSVVALAAFSGTDVDDALARASDDRDWQVREVAAALLAAGRD